MNYRGQKKCKPLPPCRVCDLDGGLRMVTDTVPEQYYIVCQVCGFRTKKHPTRAAATRDWSGKFKK
ncbi:MAG: hypothetical protein IJV74_06915 [Clostridia bacterium]|nr:hypothetical protein [Clostridia bacterium]